MAGGLAAILLAALCGSARAADLQLSEQGLGITVTGMAHMEVPWPMLMPGEKKPIESHVGAHGAELKYANGAEVSISLAPGGAVEYRWRHMPKEVVSFHLTTWVGADIGDGGTWRIGNGAPTAFPKDKPAKPFLYQGHDSGITITDVIGHAITITVPEHSFLQLQDNREWGNPIFQWQASVPYNRDWEVHRIAISEGAAPKARILVDRFGQSTLKEFPGKVRDEQELIADAASDPAYYAGLAPAATDELGGRPAAASPRSGARASSASRSRVALRCWWIPTAIPASTSAYAPSPSPRTTPTPWSGRASSPGCRRPAATPSPAAGITTPSGTTRRSPSCAPTCWKYGTGYALDGHIGVMVDRVRAMGFNAIGAFSGDAAFAAKHIPRVEMCG